MNKNQSLDQDLIITYLMGEASPEEAIAVEKYIQKSEENKLTFSELAKVHRAAFQKPFLETDKDAAWAKLEKVTINNSNTRVIWLGIAAVFVLGVLAVFSLFPKTINNREFIALEQSVSKVLSDKSEVTIFQNSTLKLAEGFGVTNRNMILNGKANFNVSHEGRHPFIVQAGNVMIEDIGTAFTIENHSYSDTVYVVVNEGIVRMYDENGQELLIKAGEKAWYIKSEKRIIADTATKVIKFDFRNTKLSDAVRFLEDAYDVVIELDPKQLGDCVITTQFFDEDLPTIINVITETNGLSYEYYHNTYKIRGGTCQ